MKKAVLIRYYEEKQTLGTLLIFDKEKKIFECKTLELSWNNNRQNISCIPTGIYYVGKHISPKFGVCFEICDVPKRTDILFHPGNFNMDTYGCILPGESFKDINMDGLKDVVNSKKAMEKMLNICSPNQFQLIICATEPAILQTN
jgi:hypothetical protein